MSNIGWIRLHRQITDCWVWDDDEPYTKAQAWIYLLMIVNHTEVKTYFDGDIITVNTGQRITSIRKLADKFKWSRTKVTHFLSLLEQDNMVKVESDSKKTLITVINYEKYQSDEPQESHKKDSEKPQESHRKATDEPLKSTNNNDNNDNNDKNDNIIPPISPQGESEGKKIKRFVKPTVEQVQEYCDSRNNGISGQEFIDYYDSIGWNVGKKPMKDWQAAVRTWENKRKTTNSTGYVKRWNV